MDKYIILFISTTESKVLIRHVLSGSLLREHDTSTFCCSVFERHIYGDNHERNAESYARGLAKILGMTIVKTDGVKSDFIYEQSSTTF